MVIARDRTVYRKFSDKKDSFLFLIVFMPYPDSNVPSEIFAFVSGTKVLRSVKKIHDGYDHISNKLWTFDQKNDDRRM